MARLLKVRKNMRQCSVEAFIQEKKAEIVFFRNKCAVLRDPSSMSQSASSVQAASIGGLKDADSVITNML